jgi:mono/diheme cytochrome c family protein
MGRSTPAPHTKGPGVDSGDPSRPIFAYAFWGAVVLAVLLVAGTLIAALWRSSASRADPANAAQVALGRSVYEQHCASCHGAKLEGQPNWRDRLPSGRMPAPPHDETGHTWHHPDGVLFGITKEGLVPGKYAPRGYASDMPGFGGVLSDDEIWAVLAYVKNAWPPREREHQREIERKSGSRR